MFTLITSVSTSQFNNQDSFRHFNNPHELSLFEILPNQYGLVVHR